MLDYLTSATNQGLRVAKTISFLSMALANNDNLLASIKATTSTYPLRGTVVLKDFTGEVLSNDKGTPNPGYIWVEPKLVEALNLKQNDQLVIGNTSFVVEAILDDYPDRNVGFLAFSPTIITNIADLKSMGVIQTGSRVVYRQLFSGTENQVNLFFDSVSNLPEKQETSSIESAQTVITEEPEKKESLLPDKPPKEQYEFAVSFMKIGDYETAEFALKEFIQKNKGHDLAGNAQYWYGETFRIRQLYSDAATAYLDGYQNYPKSKKAPDNLLKLGITMVQLGEKDQGCKMISGVKKEYPKASKSVLQKAQYEQKKFKCAKS